MVKIAKYVGGGAARNHIGFYAMFSAIRVELHLNSQDKTEFEKYNNLKAYIIYSKPVYLLFKIKPRACPCT